MKKTICLLACFSILCALSCRKTADDPAVFRNSFSCKINGVDWKPEGGSNATGGANMPDIIVTKFSFKNAVSIDALKQVRDPNNLNVNLKFEVFAFEFALEVREQIFNDRKNYFYDSANKCSNYYPDTTATSRVIVTELDTVNKIVSGRFSFDLKSENCKPKLSVTEGDFKLKY